MNMSNTSMAANKKDSQLIFTSGDWVTLQTGYIVGLYYGTDRILEIDLSQLNRVVHDLEDSVRVIIYAVTGDSTIAARTAEHMER